MDTVINRRVIQLVVDGSQVARSTRNIETSMDRITRAGRAATRVFGSIAAVVGVNAFGNLISGSVQLADSIGKTADKVGVGVEALQELRFAAELSGVEARVLDTALQRFSRRAGEAAQGSGELVKTLDQLGISTRDSNGAIKSTGVLLGEYADAVKNAGSDQERLRLAFKAFDSEGAALVNTLRNGKEGLDELRQAARDAGVVLEENLVRTAEEINDRWTILSRQFQTTIGVQILESLESAFSEAPKVWLFAVTQIGKGLDTLEFAFDNAFAVILDVIRASVAGGIAAVKVLITSVADALRALAQLASFEVAGVTVEVGPISLAAQALDKVAGSFEYLQGLARGEPLNLLGDEDLQSRLAIRDRFFDSELLRLEEQARALKRNAQLRREALGTGTVGSGSSGGNSQARKELRDAEKAAKDAERATDRFFNDIGQQIERLNTETRTAREILESELARIELLRKIADGDARLPVGEQRGIVFGAETERRARQAAQEKYNDSLREQEDLFRRNNVVGRQLGESIAGGLERAILQGEKFGNVLQGIADDILAITLRKTVTNPIADFIGGIDFGAFFGGGGGGIERVVPGPVRNITPLPSAAAVPSSITPPPGDVVRIAKFAREAPAPTQQPVTVEVTNNGTPQQVQQTSSRTDGERLVVSLITSDLARRGPISAGLEGAYGVRRGG